MSKVSMTVNGKPVAAEVEPRTLLVNFIREQLRLTGTHVGCDTAQCGACTDPHERPGREVLQHAGDAGRGRPDRHHRRASPSPTARCTRCRRRSATHHGLQCGFCTPGMVMSAIDLVKNHPNPTEATIRAELDGNLCRCTGYHNIVKAVQAGAQAMRS